MTTYIIDDGDTFEGTIDQFRDCFFSNADEESMLNWCKEKNCKLEKRFTLFDPNMEQAYEDHVRHTDQSQRQEAKCDPTEHRRTSP
jgi:hypothetical protein